MPRAKPATTPHDDEAPDRGAAARQTIVHSTATGSQRPTTTGAASVFALGKAARPKRGPQFDPDTVTVQPRVPIPEMVNRQSPYARLLQRMEPGDMVELTTRQAYGLISAAKKLGIKHARRSAEPGLMRVWRL